MTTGWRLVEILPCCTRLKDMKRRFSWTCRMGVYCSQHEWRFPIQTKSITTSAGCHVFQLLRLKSLNKLLDVTFGNKIWPITYWRSSFCVICFFVSHSLLQISLNTFWMFWCVLMYFILSDSPHRHDVFGVRGGCDVKLLFVALQLTVTELPHLVPKARLLPPSLLKWPLTATHAMNTTCRGLTCEKFLTGAMKKKQT